MPEVARCRVVGPLASYAEGLRAEVLRLGYTQYSAELQVWVAGRLSKWMATRDLRLVELTDSRVQEFLVFDRAGGRRTLTIRGMSTVLGYLRGLGVLPSPDPVALTAVDELIERYRRWLIIECGLADRTVGRYVGAARRMLTEQSDRDGGGDGTRGLTGSAVTAFLLRECTRLSAGSAKGVVAELRSLLRFLYVQGLTLSPLAAAVPPVAGWRDTRLPATISAADVMALLEGCDRSGAAGRRDYAILVLLARLGLRSAEVAGLGMDDVDWRHGEILIRGKGRRDDRLPLPADVGEALVGYLVDGRPTVTSRTVFMTVLAPLRPMHPTTVSRVVVCACKRAGLPPVRAHRLRHALATALLAQGADLIEIGQVLRHRDVATTAVYAKVDHETLRQLAPAWPGSGR